MNQITSYSGHITKEAQSSFVSVIFHKSTALAYPLAVKIAKQAHQYTEYTDDNPRATKCIAQAAEKKDSKHAQIMSASITERIVGASVLIITTLIIVIIMIR